MHFSQLLSYAQGRVQKVIPAALGLSAMGLGSLFLGAPSASAQVLFNDDFNGSSLNTSNWGVYESWQQLGRTQFGLTPTVGKEGTTTFLRMAHNTYNTGYNASNPLMQSSEIYSKNNFKMGTGLEFEARLRGVNMPRGMVYGLYTYHEKGIWPDGYLKDEMDFEVCTNLAKNQFWSNIWNDWNSRNGGGHNVDGIVTASGMDYTNWTTYTSRWYPDRGEWYINGVLVRTIKTVVPDDPMSVHFNAWAPNSGWGMAYDSFLQPTGNPASNYACYLDVDYVHVKRLPAPSKGTWGTGDGLRAQYFNNTGLSGAPSVTRVDPAVNNDWGNYSPDPNVPNDNYSARWTGYIQSPFTENVTLTLRADDGVRLYLNGVKKIDSWIQTAATDRSVTVAMTAGVKVPITIEYFENTGGASAQFYWSSPSMAKTPVPQCQLYSGDTVAPTIAISSPVANSTQRTLASVTGTAADNRQDSGVTSVGSVDSALVTLKRLKDNLYWDGSTWATPAVELQATGTTSWTLPLPALIDSTYTVGARAVDMAGNTSAATSRNFTISSNADTTPPTLTMSAPTEGFSYTSLSAAGTASDASGISAVKATIQRLTDNLYWNGSSWVAAASTINVTLSGSNWNLSLSFLPYGHYSIAASATDKANNVANVAARTFWIDTIAPTATITTPKTGTTYPSLASATGAATDTGPGISRVSLALMRNDGYWWTGSTWSANYTEVNAAHSGTSWSYSLPALSAGPYILWAQPYDYADNFGSWVRSDFTIKAASSALTASAPAATAAKPAASSAPSS